MGKAPTQVVFDDWETFVAKGERGPIFISFDDGVTKEDFATALPECTRIIINILHPNRQGGPDDHEAEQLWNMEDDLCDALSAAGVPCRLVGRITYSGDRELVFQTADQGALRDVATKWCQPYQDYEIGISEHSGWQFFNDCVRPTDDDRLLIADRQVVDALLENGSDPDKPHNIEYFFLGEPDRLRQIQEKLSERGYRLQKFPANDDEALVMSIELLPDLFDIYEHSLENHRLAREIGVRCDGWGAAIVS